MGPKRHRDLRHWPTYSQRGCWLLLMYVVHSRVNVCLQSFVTNVVGEGKQHFVHRIFVWLANRELSQTSEEPRRHHASLLAANREGLHHHELLGQTCCKWRHTHSHTHTLMSRLHMLSEGPFIHPWWWHILCVPLFINLFFWSVFIFSLKIFFHILPPFLLYLLPSFCRLF